MYEVLANESFNGDTQKAIKLLVRDRHFKNSDIASSCFCASFLLIMTLIIVYIIAINDSTEIYPSMCFFRLFYSFSIIVLGFSWIVYFMDRYRLHWLIIFDAALNSKVSYMQIMKFSLYLLTICHIMAVLNLSTLFYYPESVGNLIPGILAILFLMIFLLPYRLYQSGRCKILWAILNAFISPFGSIRFYNYLIGCWLTSLIISLKDIYCCILFYYSDSWTTNKMPVANKNILIFISCFPFFIRISQNIKRVFYKKSLLIRQISNCTRYAISLSLFLTAYQGYYNNFIWISCFIIGTCILAYYDIFQDWQINIKCCSLELKKRFYPSNFYYFSAIFNFLLRFIGTATLLPVEVFQNDYINSQIILTIFLFIEIFRKILWTVIRIERERIDNKEKFRSFDYFSTID